MNIHISASLVRLLSLDTMMEESIKWADICIHARLVWLLGLGSLM